MKTPSNPLRRLGLALLGLGIAASAAAFTFVLNSGTGLPIKWPPSNIPLKVMLTGTAATSGAPFSDDAAAAAQAWNGVSGSAQIQTSIASGTVSDHNGVNELGFSTTIFGQRFGSGVLAVTTGWQADNGNQRSEADILVNSAVNWDSYPGSLRSATDIRRVLTHEMGHLLGLDHPDQASPRQSVNAIMNSTVSNVDALTSDDIQGVQSLYGPPGIPANDAFANAFTLTLNTTGSVTVNGVNTNATKEGGDPRQADTTGGRSVWWRWTAPSAGNVTLDTKGSYYDTTLGVYTGSTLSSLTKVTDNDDINAGVVQASSVTFTATGGTTYRFMVDGYNNIDQDKTDQVGADSGGITLNLNFTSTGASVPIITTQPAGLTVTAGNSASFSVVATSTPAATFQWLFNGTAIAGATSATYSISSTSTAQAGTYSVTVSNPAGSVTSDGATLTVNTPIVTPAPAPSGGGGGGGGAPSLWFYAVLAALGLARLRRLARR